jgi:hypothetical protein
LRALRVLVAVAFVVLLTFTNVRPSVAQQTSWVNPTLATQYAQNMVSNYYNAVRAYAQGNPNFPEVQPFFWLYDGVGYSFDVYVVRQVANDNGCVAFVFSPDYGVSKPVIHIDNNTSHTIDYYVNSGVSIGSCIAQLLEENDTTLQSPRLGLVYVVWGVLTSTINGGGQPDALNASLTIYNGDVVNAKEALTDLGITSTTTTVTSTSTATSTSIETYAPVGSQPDNTPLYVAIVILAAAVVLMFFGTGERILEVITHKKERRKVKNDWRLLWRMVKRWYHRNFEVDRGTG